ncbi:hypothetical protein QA645_17065 [Bradyrhizobium sp. CIAT3101]|uniref:helix-turn-helix transcriptional regulator n=1 Tax=Bradyrhizobium sp. CIAT3101 TaxID=439387 RepID=UPI0024B122DB|nr:hypothetical protein [Bradyrhizobium sp. CIAT3101]WFU84383.1 hypothetical protein QA645_17065 [Bradyrhizobium sp. CIAT3101]
MEAADYIGATPETFDDMVKVGTMPKPKKIGGADRWDRVQLDRCFDAISGTETNSAVIEFETGPLTGKRLSIEERRALPNWGLSVTDSSTWLTEGEAKIWLEDCREEEKQAILGRPMAATERRALRELTPHRGEFVPLERIGKGIGFACLEKLVWRGYAKQGQNNADGKATFQITDAGLEAANRI